VDEDRVGIVGQLANQSSRHSKPINDQGVEEIEDGVAMNMTTMMLHSRKLEDTH